MTRIGKVTVRYNAAPRGHTVIQEITEDGQNHRALFKYDGFLINGDEIDLSPGAINRVTHFRYRRVG